MSFITQVLPLKGRHGLRQSALWTLVLNPFSSRHYPHVLRDRRRAGDGACNRKQEARWHHIRRSHMNTQVKLKATGQTFLWSVKNVYKPFAAIECDLNKKRNRAIIIIISLSLYWYSYFHETNKWKTIKLVGRNCTVARLTKVVKK